MKKIVSAFIALIFLVNTTLAYTLKITVKGMELEVTRKAGNVIELEKLTKDIIGWEVKKGDIEIVDDKFIMPEEDVEIEAITQEAVGRYKLTVESPFVSTTEKKLEGQSVTVNATSSDAHEFYKWKATGITLTAEQEKMSTLTFTMPSNAVTLEAIYEII